MDVNPTAFWNVNIVVSEWTANCPDYLQYCFQNEKDKTIIGTPDSQYHILTWEEVRDYATRNRPDLFQRLPSELRKYRHFCHQLQGQYGGVLDFILKERLQWNDTKPSAGGFSNTDNYKILYNDWPYGVDRRIVHLVVWTKFEMPENPVTGLLVPDMQSQVDAFMEQHFYKPCQKDSVVWFRNWVSLKSVHAVEHFHVMLLGPDTQFVDHLTNGDQPLAVKLGYISR